MIAERDDELKNRNLLKSTVGVAVLALIVLLAFLIFKVLGDDSETETVAPENGAVSSTSCCAETVSVTDSGPTLSFDTSLGATTSLHETATSEKSKSQVDSVVGADPADNADNSIVHVDCPPMPGDCAAAISRAIKTNKQRPLKVTFGDKAKQIDVSFGSAIILQSQVSIEGLNQPNIIRIEASYKMFHLDGVKDVSIRGFNIDLRACRTKADGIFVALAQASAATKFSNVHVSNIEAYNGNRFFREEAQRLWLRPNNPGDCEFARFNTGGDGLHFHNIKASNMRKFFFLRAGQYSNVTLQNNDVELMNKGFYSQFAAAQVDGLNISDNKFSKIAAGHGNDQKVINAVEFIGAGSGKANSSQVNISNNVIEAPSYQSESENFADRKVSSQKIASLADTLVLLNSITDFTIEGNTIRNTAGDGIVFGTGVGNGTVTDNNLSAISGTEISPAPSGVKLR